MGSKFRVESVVVETLQKELTGWSFPGADGHEDGSPYIGQDTRR